MFQSALLLLCVICLNMVHVLACNGAAAGFCDGIRSVLYETAAQYLFCVQAVMQFGYGTLLPKETPYDQP